MAFIAEHFGLTLQKYLKLNGNEHLQLYYLKTLHDNAEKKWDRICKLKNELKVLKRKRKNREEDKILTTEQLIQQKTDALEQLEECIDKYESNINFLPK